MTRTRSGKKGLKSAFDEDSLRKERPYTNILVPLLDNETELKNELTDLKDSISNIMKAVVVFQDMNSFGQYIMKDEMLDRFFHEYFFIKNNGLIPAQISFIKNRLRMLRQGEIFERMIAECAGRFQMSMEEAEEKIEHYFAELQYFLSVEYEENMELIDTRINNYYNLANTRIMLMAGNGIRLEAVLNDFLNAMPELGEEKQDEAMGRLSGCTRIINQKYVGYRSFEKKKRGSPARNCQKKRSSPRQKNCSGKLPTGIPWKRSAVLWMSRWRARRRSV